MEAGSGSERARATLAYLRQRIATGEWPINGRIPKEPELMELLGVGKTTVREAVRSLASVGMLETLPGRGTFVRSRTPVSSVLTSYLADFEIGEVLGYRRALEVEAAQQAALHRSESQLAALRAAYQRDLSAEPDYPRTIERGVTPGPFHHLVFEATGNRLLPSLYSGVMAELRRAIDSGEIGYGADHELRHHDHAAILAAIEARDPIGAAHAMALHADRDLIPRPASEA